MTNDNTALFDNLVRYEIDLWIAIDKALQGECDLHLTWFEILRLLDAHDGGVRVQDIAAEFAITVGGTSKVVDRIEAAGYCARRANPDDRRSSLVALTPAGREILAAGTVVFDRELDRRIGAVLDDDTIRAVGSALEMLRAAGRSADSSR
ncbi:MULTISPECIES: MarR family winged helix-turn-helix transcriptional regulator [unclassified Rhodococcus (in: high G+C Gram-positive bacteria)]|uniref:MarR family winged helix-turn-helix transcriptional regulator n=1 Tax=unclassified Rhodococcus (in: high G+C Gram-positive bacteria) TaxID=192944 RepID=UPI000480AEB9|nr:MULTISPECIES: MarR family transcriptional regulator [unclassified Rhodococcus (in: high G+C Gram-positive bacteria)]MDQ1179452.1 DNA-binding MarR family transcriptional regulator [Rhodococcus sp. SORGH_AS_0301]